MVEDFEWFDFLILGLYRRNFSCVTCMSMDRMREKEKKINVVSQSTQSAFPWARHSEMPNDIAA